MRQSRLVTTILRRHAMRYLARFCFAAACSDKRYTPPFRARLLTMMILLDDIDAVIVDAVTIMPHDTAPRYAPDVV